MMAPDYAHWHGMFEVAERFYMQLIPQARELAEQAAESGNEAAGRQRQPRDRRDSRPAGAPVVRTGTEIARGSTCR